MSATSWLYNTAEVTGKPEEDRRLFQLIEAKKSWVYISANLKRPAKTARDRLAYLLRQAIKDEFESGPAEPTVKAKGK